MSSEIYTHRFSVPASAIDVRNHVNNLTYLEWCLEAAEAHWGKNATPKMQAEYIWYVLHHSIDYRASAFEGEQLEVRTWVTSAEGVKSERHYRILRIKDNKTLIEAKSHRPTKITDEIRTLF